MSKAKQMAAAAAASDAEAAKAAPRKTQKLTADIKRIEELEEAGIRLINARNKKQAAIDQEKAAYSDVKEIMRRLKLSEYAMTDCEQILEAVAEDIKIKVKDKPTA